MGTRRSVCVRACAGAQAPMGLCARASAAVCWQWGAWCWRWLNCHECAQQEGAHPQQSVLSGRGLDSSRMRYTGGGSTAAGVPGGRGLDGRGVRWAGGVSTAAGCAGPEGSRQQQGVLCWRWLDCSGGAGQEGSRPPQKVQSGRGLNSSKVCCAGGGSTAVGVLAGGASTAVECAEREGSRQQRDALCWRWLNCSEGAGRRGRRGIGRGRGGCGAWRERGKARVAWW
jgi:hypothetical protein